MMSFFGWLAGTRAGRITLVIAAALAAFFYAFARAFSAGRDVQKAEQDKETLNAYRERERVDDDISKMDEPRARFELSRWMRTDDI